MKQEILIVMLEAHDFSHVRFTNKDLFEICKEVIHGSFSLYDDLSCEYHWQKDLCLDECISRDRKDIFDMACHSVARQYSPYN